MCLCVCLCRLLQLLKDESSASKSFYRLLVMFTWILIRWICKIMLRSRVMLSFAYLECHGIAAFSEEHVAKLVYRVLLLYLVVSSALER